MNRVAIITARGGSKRIPRKNVRSFCGKPIITYSIQAALESGCFEEVMVSTDDQEIADIARKAGARVPFFRSPETSHDHATTAEVLIEVLERYRQAGKEFSHACCLYPTAPFLTGEKIRGAWQVLAEKQAPSVISIVRFGFPIQRALKMKAGALIYGMPEFRDKRSQDLEPFYHDAGQMYWFAVTSFLETRSLFMNETTGFECSELEVQDIDNETDWKIAEIKFQMMGKAQAF